jgi:hypothetical protein
MGFDLYINLILHLDPETGLPYVYVYDAKRQTLVKRAYSPEEHRVPEQYRKYIYQRGHHFHAYIQPFLEHTTMTDAIQFLLSYPSWDSVLKECGSELMDCWTEDDHNGFKEALEWMHMKEWLFLIRWSY